MPSIRRTHLRRLAVACLATCLLSACETQPTLASLSSSLPAMPSLPPMLGGTQPPISPEAALPPAPERKWADPVVDANNNRAAGWGLVSMPAMDAYLNRLYAQLKDMSGHPDWPGRVYVLADPALKSTASAAGNIYVSITWLQSMESEDEVFALLSHEFGHVYLNHSVVYDASDAGLVASQLGVIGVALAHRGTQVANLNGAYAIVAIREVAESTLMPAWKRSVEEEADRFGVALSLRAGYSYPRGFKTFLERVASYDDVERERAQKAQAELEQQARAAGIQAVQDQSRQAQAQARQKNPNAPAIDTTDLQVQFQNSLFDATSSVKRAFSSTADKLRETHDDATVREENLAKAVAAAIAERPRPPGRVAPWEAVRKEAGTAEILAHYALLGPAEEAIARKNYPEALRIATRAASGRTASDALPLMTLVSANLAARPNVSVTALRDRHRNSVERSWKFELMAGQELARTNRTAGRKLIDEQFAYFRKAPVLWPDVIAFYRDNNYLDEARAMAGTCRLEMVSYSESCQESAKTVAEKQAEKAAGERKGKEIAERNMPKFLRPKP